jgi:endonuclease YncB( thermonuclease family)
MKRKHRRIAALIAAAVILLFAWAGERYGWFETPKEQFQQNQPGLYEVVRFSDGDTITVNMNGKNETIRMIGVDTPETHDPNTPVQCYGAAASAYTKNLIGDQKVRLEADPTNQNRDRYDRLLRYVYLPDGRLVEAEIIKNGSGFSYTQFPFTKAEEFEKLEDEAEQANRGLWSNCTVTVEESGREQTNPAE